MRLSIFKFLSVFLLCLCAAHTAIPAVAKNNNHLPVTRGEIIRDTARLTFEWQKPVGFSLNSNGKKITIIFERNANPDTGEILSSLYPYITHVERKPDGKTFILALKKPYKVRKFASKNIGGIELVGVEPSAKQQNTADKIKQQAKNLSAAIAKETPIKSSKEVLVKNLDVLSAMDLSLHNPSESEYNKAKSVNLAKNTPSSEPANSELAKLSPAAGEEEKKSEEVGDGNASPNSSSEEYKEVQNKVAISSADDSTTLRFPLAERTALAIFRRNHYLWIVLEKPVKLDLSEFSDLEKTVIRKPEVIENPKATILYIPIDDNVYVNLSKEDSSNNLAILITQNKQPTLFPLPVEVSTAPPAPPHVLIPTLEMEDPIVVRDPVIGDSLVITPLYKIGEAVTQSRDFIEFSLLETVQGIAIVKKDDDVSIVQLRNGLRVTTTKGATISPNLPKLDPKAANDSLKSIPTLFPYEIWKPETTKSRSKQIQELFQKIVKTDSVQDANNSRLRLAQIYLSEGMAAEANALLDGIYRVDPSFYRSAKLSALHGVGNFLMTRFPEASRDFAATELNNNKEMEYWRAVLSDLLGKPDQNYDYLEMNEDYISKYPPVFRQKLAIVAADQSISTKDYNVALKILDSLHQDNLIGSINVYVNFLMAKISMDTGQDEEASENLDKLAEDHKHPFVRARAEFTRIARDMEAGMSKEKSIDRLERLRLNWHGDSLELKVLTLLGDLYHEKKDYVNAMRVWDNGIKSFKNTTASIDMKRKMEEAFIIMFNEGIADSLPPLEALALYYEYRSYMPGGIAGSEMLDRLSNRLISVDLLEQAVTLLDHQMRTQTEKEKRSRIGAKLATTYLMNKQPQKALTTLQDSVFGENPVLLRLQRNRLAAQAIMELGKPDLALQTLGQDDSIEAERVRIGIYWKAKDWTKLTSSIEHIVKNRPDITAPINLDESEYLIQLALAYIFTDNKEQIQYLRDYFTPLMANNPNKKMFEFVTAEDVIPTSRNFEEVAEYMSNARSFIRDYKAQIKLLDTPKPTKTAAVAVKPEENK